MRLIAMKRTMILLAALIVSITAIGRAETKTVTITVDAEKVDRVNSPVRVPLDLPAKTKASVTLKDAAGNSLPGQITGPSLLSSAQANAELVFIVPSLKAGQKATYTATINTEPATTAAAGFKWTEKPGESITLDLAGRPVLQYMCLPYNEAKDKREATYKVYHHVYDPTGKFLLTKGPGGQFTHHRGIFFGFNKVTYDGNKQVDIWHCTKDTHQTHEGVVAADAGAVLGRHRLAIDWHGDKKEVFAKEERELTAYNTPGGVLLEFASRVTPVSGTIKVDGDPQHAGFHFRASQEVSEKTAKLTYYLRPDGKGKLDETRNWPGQKDHINLPWNCMSFMVQDQRFTCAYLDKPTNPKEARFSERDYGRFGSYFATEFTPEKPLQVNYRLWVQPGEMTGEQAKLLDEQFVEPAKVTVK